MQLRFTIILQALLKNRQRFSIMTWVKKHHPEMLARAYNLERDLMNLALLPQESIEEAFEELSENISENEELHQIIKQYLDYYRAQWLTRVGPKNYSVHLKFARTNNVTERYHRSLKSLTATRPEIMKFFGELLYSVKYWHQKKRFFVINPDFIVYCSSLIAESIKKVQQDSHAIILNHGLQPHWK